jgi:hypothetical protein
VYYALTVEVDEPRDLYRGDCKSNITYFIKYHDCIRRSYQLANKIPNYRAKWMLGGYILLQGPLSQFHLDVEILKREATQLLLRCLLLLHLLCHITEPCVCYSRPVALAEASRGFLEAFIACIVLDLPLFGSSFDPCVEVSHYITVIQARKYRNLVTTDSVRRQRTVRVLGITQWHGV